MLAVLGGCIETEIRSEGAKAAEDPRWALSAEESGFEETASYDEVVSFLEQAAQIHPNLHVTRMGYTNEGRAIPVLVAGPVDGPSPAEVREASARDGLPVVYIQGNIHAGEVAGKEALLRLVRDLALDRRPALLGGLVLLIGPIYNADGNEALDLRNRPLQHGPLGGMGTRTNAQGLDLNRDQMKLDSPEARGLARLMTEFDPHVLVDLHTTNGTRHGYHLTYSPPLHPATPGAIDSLLRDELLPATTRGLEERYGWHAWHYGNAMSRAGTEAWWTFDHRPRFVTNYTGIRNRIGILSEAYSYATFEDRILATERFVDETLEWVRGQSSRIVELIEEEDRRDLRGTRLPLRADFAAQASVHPILLGEVVEETHPWTGETILRRLDVTEEVPMPAYVSFQGTEDETVPLAYLLPSAMAEIVERLRAHGVRTEATPAPTGLIERFPIRARSVADESFQGRHEVTVEGEWLPAGEGIELDGYLVVEMDQPLARLAFLLLEPRSDDGFTSWALMDPWIEDANEYPILRVVADAAAP